MRWTTADGDNTPTSSFSPPKLHLGDLKTNFASVLHCDSAQCPWQCQEGVTWDGNKLDLTWAHSAPHPQQRISMHTKEDSASSILDVSESTLGFTANGRTIVVEHQKLLTLNTSEKAAETQSFDWIASETFGTGNPQCNCSTKRRATIC